MKSKLCVLPIILREVKSALLQTIRLKNKKKNKFPSHLRRRRRHFSISNEMQSVWCHGFGLGLFYGSIDSNFERTQRICTSAKTYSMNML